MHETREKKITCPIIHKHPSPKSRSTTMNGTMQHIPYDDSLDWNHIKERKPNFTEKAHSMTYTSQHCHHNHSTNHRRWYRIYQRVLHPMEYLDVWLNELLIYILPTHYYTHF
jgi:phosphoribosylformylglycinamidine (FGAM) synthase-like enzyme